MSQVVESVGIAAVYLGSAVVSLSAIGAIAWALSRLYGFGE